MDGIAFLKEVMSRFGSIPFILFTGRGREEVVIDAINNGADFYLQKGGDPLAQFAELMHKIRQAITRRKAQEELRAACEQLTASEEELRAQLDELSHTQQDQEKTEKNFRNLVDNAPDAIFIQADNRFVYLNNAAIRLFGASSADQLLGKNPWDRIHPSFHEKVRSRVKSLTVDEKSVGQLDEVYLKLDGTPVDVEVTAVPFLYEGEHGALVMLRDITARKRDETELRAAYEQLSATEKELREQYKSLALSEQRIRESDLKFRNLAELLPQIVFEMDLDFKITFVNNQAFTQLGFTPDDVAQGFKALSIIDPLQHSRVRENIGKIIRGEPFEHIEYTFIRKNGSTFPALVYANPVHEGGKLTGFRGIIVDISDRKRTEEALRQSEDIFRLLITSAPLPMSFANNKGEIEFINDRFKEIFGYTLTEVPTVMDWLNRAYPDREYRKQVIKTWDAAVKKGLDNRTYIEPAVYNVTCSDGSVRNVIISGITFGDRLLATFNDITEQQKMEIALRESERTFRRVIEGAPEAIYIGTDWKFAYLNPAALRLFGASSSEELIGTPFMDLIHPRFHDIIRSRVHQLYDERAAVPLLEEVYLRLDGTEIDGEVSSVPFQFAGRNGALVFIRDITDRKKAEKDLRESEDRYRRLISHSFDAVIVHQDGRIVLANDAAIRIIGADPGTDLTGRQMLSFVHPDFRKLVKERVRHMLKSPGGTVPLVEEKFIRLDGTTVDVEVMASAMVHEGKPAVIVVFRDITERKRAEEALRESEQRYRSVIENIEDGFVRTDKEGGFTIVSPSAAHMLGYDSAEEMISMPVDLIYRNRKKRKVMLDLIRKQKYVRDYEMALIRKDGSVFWASLSAHFLYDGKGGIVGTEAVIRDITERKNMVNAIREVNRKLNLLNRITRHDISNQLTALQGYVDIAGRIKSSRDVADLLVKIDSSAQTIKRQLEFTRAYQDLGVKAPVWQDISEILVQFQQSEVSLSTDIKGIEVFADPMLPKVFSNLMDNTIRHGGRTTRAVVQASAGSDGLTIVWKDDGVGIPEDEKEKIFRRGYGKNTGLGLFLAREILTLTGITIRETGEPGRGARFEIHVPKGSYRISEPA